MGQDKQNTYNVLWVEDNDTEVEGYQSRGRRFGLNLVRVSSWESAETELETNFEEYSAIILDANCKIHKRDKVEKENFIPVILSKLSEIFASKQKYIPWYILSAGTMKQFNFVIEVARESRVEYKNEWGEMVFKKEAPEGEPDSPEALFRQICKVAEEKYQNSVLYKHKDVFFYLGKKRLINYKQAREYMLKMLDALYFPEDHLEYEYEGNPIRKVLEYVFRTAEKLGLIPEGFVDNGRLSDSSKFMAGQTVPYKKDSSDFIRWGKEGKDRIFDRDMELCVKGILNYSNPASHTKKDEPYRINEKTKELFFGYVMQLCYVILWFGEYVEEHPSSLEENKKMHRIIKKPVEISCGEVIGKEGYVLNAGKFYYVLSCRLSPECAALVKVSDKVVIRDVVENDDEETKAEYPFIATKITPVTEG